MDYERHWSKNMVRGKVEVDENGWLHIVLDTLLPHCKRGTNPWLRDTLSRRDCNNAIDQCIAETFQKNLILKQDTVIAQTDKLEICQVIIGKRHCNGPDYGD